jgi:anti-sigma-K factor RskA
MASKPRETQKATAPSLAIRMRPRWLALAPIAVAVALAIVSVGLLLQVQRLKQALQHEQAISAHAKEVLEMLDSPTVQRMTLVSAGAPPQPHVKTLYHKEKGHILLMASNLEPIPDDKVYQLWLLPANGHPPMPAGTFRIDSKGNSMMLHAMETEGIDAKAFAITVEPVGGSTTPTPPIKYAPAS